MCTAVSRMGVSQWSVNSYYGAVKFPSNILLCHSTASYNTCYLIDMEYSAPLQVYIGDSTKKDSSESIIGRVCGSLKSGGFTIAYKSGL